MGDTRSGKNLTQKERLKKAVELTYTAWQKKSYRDEFFMQVIKQTTNNKKPKSLEWGWKLMSAYLYYFPPTIRFQSYLEGYLYKNKENDLNEVPSKYWLILLRKVISCPESWSRGPITQSETLKITQLTGYLDPFLSDVPVMVYAEYCHDRLGKMAIRGAKHGQKKPSDDDIAHAMVRSVSNNTSSVECYYYYLYCDSRFPLRVRGKT